MKAKALVAFYHDGLNVAAGQVLEVDAATFRRYGPAKLEIVSAAPLPKKDPAEGGAKQAGSPADKQARPTADK